MPNVSLDRPPAVPLGLVSNEAIALLSPVVPGGRSQPADAPRDRPGFVPTNRIATATEAQSFDGTEVAVTAVEVTERAGSGRQSLQVWLTSLPLAVGDVATIFVSFMLATFLGEWVFGAVSPLKYATEAAVVATAYLIIATVVGLLPATGMNPVWELRQLTLAGAMSFTLIILSNLTLGQLTPVEATASLLGGTIALIVLPLQRSVVRLLAARQRWWGERMLVIGGGSQGQAIFDHFNRGPQRGLRPVGIVGHWTEAIDPPATPPDEPVVALTDVLGERVRQRPIGQRPLLGSVDDVAALADRYAVRWAIVAPGGCHGVEIEELIRHCSVFPHLVLLPSHLLIPSLFANLRDCAGVMGIHVRDQLRNRWARFIKRAFDTAGAAAALIALSPFFLIAALWIRWSSPGPVFYGQRRIGGGGRSFKAWKFRTMVPGADAVLQNVLAADPRLRAEWEVDHKLRNDPRIVPGVGPLLRKSSLDEIPQLWNVLWGEMSLVGPRPIVDDEVVKYQDSYGFYLRVRPGLTGLWQISGRNDTSYPERVKLDSYYVCNWSIWLDLYIIVRTIRTMLLREGAY